MQANKKQFLENSEINNNLQIKDIAEVIENVIANCTACNETGKVANFSNLLTPRSKDFNDSVAIGLAERTDPKTNQKLLLLHMIDEFSGYSVLSVV